MILYASCSRLYILISDLTFVRSSLSVNSYLFQMQLSSRFLHKTKKLLIYLMFRKSRNSDLLTFLNFLSFAVERNKKLLLIHLVLSSLVDQELERLRVVYVSFAISSLIINADLLLSIFLGFQGNYLTRLVCYQDEG